jgi:hypothetical protein
VRSAIRNTYDASEQSKSPGVRRTEELRQLASEGVPVVFESRECTCYSCAANCRRQQSFEHRASSKGTLPRGSRRNTELRQRRRASGAARRSSAAVHTGSCARLLLVHIQIVGGVGGGGISVRVLNSRGIKESEIVYPADYAECQDPITAAVIKAFQLGCAGGIYSDAFCFTPASSGADIIRSLGGQHGD